MASGNHAKGQEKSQQTFASALSSAAAEWLLIFLIYLDGLFSFLATKCAHYNKLQIPCLLCSRIDNLLGCDRPGSFKDLICHSHMLEISSLGYCHVHQKLGNICKMCEACLPSFTTEKESISDTCRSLVGKLERNLVDGGNICPTLPAAIDTDGAEVKFLGENVVEVPLLNKDNVLVYPRTRYCSCCNKLLQCRKSHMQRLFQGKFIECNDALLGQVGHDCLHHQGRLNKSVPSPSASQIADQGFDRLSHIGYMELKITSDSESEVPFSDDDDGNVPFRNNDLKEDPLLRSPKPEPAKNDQNMLPKPLSDDMCLDKLSHATPTLPKPSHLVTTEHVAEHHDNIGSSMPDVTITQGLEDLNWNEFRRNDHPSTPPNLTSQSTKDSNEAEIPAPAHCSTTTTQEIDSHPAPAKDILEISDFKSGEVAVGDVALVSSCTYVEAPKGFNSTGTELKQMQTIHKPGSLTINHMDLNDSSKLAIGHRMNQVLPRDSPRYPEDLKIFFPHIPAGRVLEFLYNDVAPSPRAHGQVDDPKVLLSKRFSVERNESSFASLDRILVSGIEGESMLDRLKRQIELDRKSMSLLYKELEEERSASAIAANQAMAMITRLQEEKAAMQMEALQYQRMMEEQAEYDQKALQEANDLLTEKEKEIQDLEAEIESYKRQLGEEQFTTKMKGVSEEAEDNLADTPLNRMSEANKILERSDTVFLDAEGNKEVILKYSSFGFEDEKLYISECLKRLEKKLHQFHKHDVDMSGPHMVNKLFPDIVLQNDVPVQGHLCGVDREGSQLGEDVSLMENDASFAGEDSHSSCAFTVKESHNGSVSLSNIEKKSKESFMVSGTTDLTTIGNEVLHLSERLEALEADRNFMVHAISSLRNVNDGVQFIQEIACHLRELRRMGSRKSEPIDM